ncbi:MAG: NAD(P)/FAD-dependent oxidoreductase [Opitutales bacterium]
MAGHAVVIAGGGAAGFFAAIHCAQTNPECAVTILERAPKVLGKVLISGGGRCNVTHACFDPKELVKAYPRGARELLGPFHHFQPADTVEFFESRGVPTKVEEDGRMFPVSDCSASIADCLRNTARDCGVTVHTGLGVLEATERSGRGFLLSLSDGSSIHADRFLLATGGNRSSRGLGIAKALGHTVTPPVPSLFTFVVKDKRLNGLAGLSVPQAEASVEASDLCERGPLLVTHWGLSGPAVLRLSAWGARELAQRRYQFKVKVNWLGQESPKGVSQRVDAIRRTNPKKKVVNGPAPELPQRLWSRLVRSAGIEDSRPWATLSREQHGALCRQIGECTFGVSSKSNFKEEFTTCGGVALPEVDFRTMQSRVCRDLYLAGEVLDIDAVTGGFNFQAAWTTGYLAGRAMAATD